MKLCTVCEPIFAFFLHIAAAKLDLHGYVINSHATRLFHHRDSIIRKIGTPCRGFSNWVGNSTSSAVCIMCAKELF